MKLKLKTDKYFIRFKLQNSFVVSLEKICAVRVVGQDFTYILFFFTASEADYES